MLSEKVQLKVRNSVSYCVLGAILCLTMLIRCDCPKVPEVDRTPPSVCLILSGPGVSTIVCSGGSSESVILDRHSSYKLAAFAVDGNGGIKRVMISGGITVHCMADTSQFATMMFMDYYAQEPSEPTDQPVGTIVPAFRTVEMYLAERGFNIMCKKPQRFQGANGAFVGTADNYRDGSASTPALILTVE